MPSKKAAPDSGKDDNVSKKKDAKSPPSLPPLMMFSDEPIERLMREQQLDADRFSETIARVCRGVEGPFNIGVFAGWGEGKTTALRQAKALLDATARSQENPDGHDIVTVWVNAWKYEHDQHPMLPLIASIVDAVEQKLKAMKRDEQGQIVGVAGDFFKKVSIGLRALAHSTTVELSGNVLPGLGAGVQLDTGKWAEEYEKLSRIHDPMLDQSIFFKADHILTQLYDTFQGANKEQLETKIVIFIDDLDRCLPDKAMALLESIKLVLAHPGFVFCLAIDRDPVDAFLQKRYKKEFGMKEYAKASGGHYLDKLIQLPLHLPRRTQQFEKHIEQLIWKYRDTIHEAGFSKKDPGLSEVLNGLFEAAPAIAKGTASNPRSLVRLLNRLLFDRVSWQAKLEAKENDGTLSDEDLSVTQFMQFAAISRMLQDKLKQEHYLMLALDRGVMTNALLLYLPKFSKKDDDEPSENIVLCRRLAELPHEYEEVGQELAKRRFKIKQVSSFSTEKSDVLSDSPYSRFEQRYRLIALAEDLDERPYLKDMLRTELGQRWLIEDDLRIQVEGYLATVSEKPDEKEKTTKPEFEELFQQVKDDSLQDNERSSAIGGLSYYFSKRSEVYELIKALAEDADTPDTLLAIAIRMLGWRYTNRPGSFELIKGYAERDKTLDLPRKEAILALAAHYIKRDEAFELLKQLLIKGRLSEKLRESVLYEIRNFEYVQSRVRQWCVEQGFFKEYDL